MKKNHVELLFCWLKKKGGASIRGNTVYKIQFQNYTILLPPDLTVLKKYFFCH